MHELDKIVEEIEREKTNVDNYTDVTERLLAGRWNTCIDMVRRIIRKHINDGWTPVKNRLPTMEEYRENDGRFILDNGNRRYAGYFDVYTGRFYYYRHITPYRAELYEDNMIIAWRPFPESYRQERSRE